MENRAVSSYASQLRIYTADDEPSGRLQVYKAPTGFPSPAQDYAEQKLDLHELLIKNPAATYFARAQGESVADPDVGIGDLLIVDRSVAPQDGHMAVCVLNGEIVMKRLQILPDGRIILHSAKPEVLPITVSGQDELKLNGVVAYAIKTVSRWSRS